MTAPAASPVASPAAADRTSVVPRATLTACERTAMLLLLSAHFDGVTPAQFAHDLDQKDWVLRIWRGTRLVGFTTVQVSDATIDGAAARIIYSGDTIVSPEAWGSPVLSRAWIGMVHGLQQSAPEVRWYWLLLTSGYRTYRFLPVFWREFWPRHDATTPPAMRTVIDTLSAARFGTQYDRASGIVRFDTPQRLRGDLAAVDAGRLADPHIAFFLHTNPGHAAGDELVCVTELCDANLTAAGRRMVRPVRTTPDPHG